MLRDFSPEMILALPALLIAITFHEFAHAWAADRLGDPTPRLRGRLTLNPLSHIDPIGFVMLLLFRFGWAKPVEINPFNFKEREKSMAVVSLAGPGMNLILGFVATFLYFILVMQMGRNPLSIMVQYLIIYNVYFAIFNMIPIPPLDGSKLLFFFLPKSTVYRYMDAVGQYGFIILILAVSTGVVSRTIGTLANSIMQVYQSLAVLLLGLR